MKPLFGAEIIEPRLMKAWLEVVYFLFVGRHKEQIFFLVIGVDTIADSIRGTKNPFNQPVCVKSKKASAAVSRVGIVSRSRCADLIKAQN